MRRLFTIFAFCFLLFAFSSPARAVGMCPGPIEEDHTGNCCDWGKKNTNPAHIDVGDPGCGGCYMGDFDNPQHTKPYGPCKYCHANVCVYGSGCEQTCNNACCDGGPPPPEECPILDQPTDRCCPLAEVTVSAPGWIDRILNALLTATVRLKEGSELRHAHVEELTERHFGTPEEDADDGIVKKLTPPNDPFIQDENFRANLYQQQGRWDLEVEGMEGGAEEVVGADKDFYKFDYATDSLYSYLAKIPGQEEPQALIRPKDENFCSPTRININLADALAKLPSDEGLQGKVLAIEEGDLCHTVLPGDKHRTCVAERSAEISVSQALGDIIGGKIKVYPRFAFLRNVFGHTIGRSVEEPSGFFAIFDLPGDPPRKEFDGETEGDFEIRISLNVSGIPFLPIPEWVGNWGWGFDVDEEAQIWQTGTIAKADEGIQQKLSPPGAYGPPTDGEDDFEEEGDFIVEKTAQPTRIANEELPKDINYHIKITAKYKSTNITIINETTVTKKDGASFKITTDKSGNDITHWPQADGPQINLEAGGVWETNYVVTATEVSPDFSDSTVTDRVSADAEEIEMPGGVGSCETCGLIGGESGWRSQELIRILNAAGSAYGVPASVLAAALYYEGWHGTDKPRVHEFDDATVEEASEPYGKDPYCIADPFDVGRGPFQFTIADPINGWPKYENAAIDARARPEGYIPEICNILDSAYAAAMKMRTDVEYQGSVASCNTWRGTPPAANSCNWTRKQISLASCRYHGACGSHACRNDPGGSQFCYCSRTNSYFSDYACEER